MAVPGSQDSIVDLTFDSSSQEDANAPPAESLPPPPRSHVKKTSIPVPSNVKQLYQPSSTLRSTPATTIRETPPASPYTTSSAASSRPTSAGPHTTAGASTESNSGLKHGYVAITRERNGLDNGANGQAEKRRKVAAPNGFSTNLGTYEDYEAALQHSGISTPVDDNLGPAKSASTSDYERFERRTTQHSTVSRMSNMKGMPTVHYLQAALRSGNAVAGISSDILTSKARTLHIGRAPEEEGENAFLTEAAKPRNRPLATPQTVHVTEPELGESDLEEAGWDEDMHMGSPKHGPTRGQDADTTSQIDRTSNPLPQREASGTIHKGDSNGFLSKIRGIRDSRGAGQLEGGSGSPQIPNRSQSTAGSGRRHGHASTTHSSSTNKSLKPEVMRTSKHFSTEEEHFMIYLKEVKGVSWSDMVPLFDRRSQGVLQSRYSTYVNRRDRTLDPEKLILPQKYQAEAAELWPPVRERYLKERTGAAHRPRREAQPVVDSSEIRNHRGYRPHRIVEQTYDSGSGTDSIQRGAVRPCRNVEAVNYTWPRRHRRSQVQLGDEEMLDDDVVVINSDSHSPEPSEKPSSPDVIIPHEQPVDIAFSKEDAALVTSGEKIPYLSSSDRSVVRNGPSDGYWDQISSRTWQGSVVHVDFSYDEIDVVEEAIETVIGDMRASSSRRKRIRSALKDQPEPKLLRLAHEIQRKVPSRDQESILAFLQDAKAGKVSSRPHIQRLAAAHPDKSFSSACRESTSTAIRKRELGLQSRRGWTTATKPLSYQMKNSVYDTLGPAYSYTGASSDVHTVAWSPDGQYFAAGAVCVTDRDSMQYNRPNNLLYGDTLNKSIRELAEHRMEREKQESGPNSTHEMHVTQDPHLYYTVSAVAFSTRGEYMFSAGYDNNAIVWKTSEGEQPQLMKALKHKAPVDLLAVSRHDKLATASRRWEKAIKVCTIGEDEQIVSHTYSSKKSDQRPDLKILPTALQFEPTYGRLLLAGFGANQREDRLDINGDICLWDIDAQQELRVYGSTKNVFDVAWMPNQHYTSIFGVGCVAGAQVNRGTRSIVRLYDGRGYEQRTMVMELECEALDMNDVVFCPYDQNLVAAGCTSGRTYVWDLRRPDDYLYTLSHGKSLMPLDERQPSEETDTGVRFLSWGDNATRLYTGSSDGVVKVWDVARSLNDVFIKDLITVDSGIMSGAFSSDKSRLIIGEVNGSINVLEVGNDDLSIKDMDKLKYIPYEEEPDSSLMSDAASGDLESGIAAANDLISTGQMITIPFGGFPIRQAVQGPNYAGPFDVGVDSPYLRQQALEFQLNLAKTPGPQCTIPACLDVVKITSEEVGDSGRSEDRIPDALSQAWKTQSSNLTLGVVAAGKSKCTRCGRPARPSSSTTNDAEQFCERCNFSCFRCGGICTIHPDTAKIVCQTCERVWDAGVLGYECVQDNACAVLPNGVPTLEHYQQELELGKGFWESNVSFGDEMSALTDYYLGLAID